MDRLAREAPRATIEPGSLSPLALKTRSLGPIADLGAFREGLLSVQDEGAQACALLLEVGAGQRILDACAGRGGKTSLLASIAPEDATIEAADRHPRKLDQLQRELDRLGLPRVRTFPVDLAVGTGELTGGYDGIFVDAPCSGTGTLARRPEIRWRLDTPAVERLCELQRAILESCLGLLAPGGVMVYCACSLLPEEGRDQVAALLERHQARGLRIDRDLTLLPHRHETDGFYAARIVAEG